MTESKYEVIVLHNGYSKETERGSLANCTCTLIKGPKNIIVDTMTAWDGDKIVEGLKQFHLTCNDIDYVVCTHGHSDHIGCNYLFQQAIHIVGFSVSHGNVYFDHNFEAKVDYNIDEFVKVFATPGHTLQDVSVLVRSTNKGVVVITGDLFENEHDLKDDSIWIKAGSDCQEAQRRNREKVLDIAEWIVPGHGPMFRIKEFEMNT